MKIDLSFGAKDVTIVHGRALLLAAGMILLTATLAIACASAFAEIPLAMWAVFS